MLYDNITWLGKQCLQDNEQPASCGSDDTKHYHAAVRNKKVSLLYVWSGYNFVVSIPGYNL